MKPAWLAACSSYFGKLMNEVNYCVYWSVKRWQWLHATKGYGGSIDWWSQASRLALVIGCSSSYVELLAGNCRQLSTSLIAGPTLILANPNWNLVHGASCSTPFHACLPSTTLGVLRQEAGWGHRPS